MATLRTDSLITLAQAQMQCNCHTGADVIKLTEIINGDQDMFMSRLGYNIIPTTYAERYSLLPNQAILTLKNRPVTSIDKIIYGITNVITVNYTDKTAISARVSVSNTAVILKSINSSGVTTTTSLAFGTYPSLSLLVAHINTLTSWNAQLISGAISNGLSDELNIVSGCNALTLTAYLTMPTSELDFTWDPNNSVTCQQIAIGWPQIFNTYPNAIYSPGRLMVLVKYTAGYSTIPAKYIEAFKRIVQLHWSLIGRTPKENEKKDQFDLMQQVDQIITQEINYLKRATIA